MFGKEEVIRLEVKQHSRTSQVTLIPASSNIVSFRYRYASPTANRCLFPAPSPQRVCVCVRGSGDDGAGLCTARSKCRVSTTLHDYRS